MKNVGDILNFVRQKDYVVVNPDLGAGSLGKTVLLKDEQLDGMLLVAKKYAPQKVSDQETFYKNFVNEAKILLSLNHKNIVRIYDWWLYPAQYTGIITMEYIAGGNLRQYLKNYTPDHSPVAPNDVFSQIVDAFCYIESKKIVHRDIKEDNILITKDGVVKIIDFGLGKVIDKENNSNHDSLTQRINREMADIHPDEELRGEYTIQTDIFYLAEMFTRLLRETQKEQFFSYSGVLSKMKEYSLEKRYQSFDEVKQAIMTKEFSTLEFSYDDRQTYQNFVSLFEDAVSYYSEEPVFCKDPEELIHLLEEIIQNNLLEDYAQRVDVFTICFIKSSHYFKTNVKIYIYHIKCFLDWFRGLSSGDQKLIMSNMAYRLSKIKINKDQDDIPF